VKRLLRRGRPAEAQDPAGDIRVEAARGRELVEQSPELVVVLDEGDRIVAASRRARESVAGLAEGEPAPRGLLSEASLRVPYEVNGRRETLVYLRDPGDLAAYEELRAGFTASVSHELRTPLARLLVLLETALLPDADADELIAQARTEVGQIGELIDDVLFLSELESGHAVVGLGSTAAVPILREVVAGLVEPAARAGVSVSVAGEEGLELPLRPRMIRVLASNLAENAIRYSGPGSSFTLSVAQEDGSVVLSGSDDGAGVTEDDVPRLFERFYRADRARASRGTGLGLAIVKHIVTSAGGTVEADGRPGAGLTIRCRFSSP
jgi:two-component system, OmpR family, phosphate regulon sensor histidine kinase PhoR